MPIQYNPLVIQGPSMTTTSSASSQTSSSNSIRSYITDSSSSRIMPSLPLPRNAVRPAQYIGGDANGFKDFVPTGQPRGGNPNGGPKQDPDGYTRVSIGKVTVHNTGGQVTGKFSTDLGPDYENGPEHCEECRKSSRRSDNQGLCFCPPKEN